MIFSDASVQWFESPSRRTPRLPRAPASERLAALRSECQHIEDTLAKQREELTFWLDNRQSLLALGQAAPERSGRGTFTHAGCVAMLLATIGADGASRADILHKLRHQYRYSYRHAGFLLTKLCGTDPQQHLWFKAEDGIYHLHG